MRSVRRTRGALSAALLALASAGCERACGRKPAATTPAGEGFLAESRRLAVIPEGVEMADGAFSPDGRSVAFVAPNREGKAQVFQEGKPGRPYEGVASVAFLPGGKGIVFAGSRGGKAVVVSGGAEGAELDGLGTILASPDGRVVYSGQRGGTWHVFSGARDVAAGNVADPVPWVSGDGRRLLYLEQRGNPGPALLHACSLDLTGCASGPTYDAIEQLVANSTATLLAFVATRGDRSTAVVVDPSKPGFSSVEAGWYDAATNPALAPTGELAFLARRGEQQLLVAAGKELPLPFSESPLELAVGPAGHTLFTTVSGNQVVAFADGKRLNATMTGAFYPVLSADGAHHAFVAEVEGDRSRVVVDGKEGPLYDKVVGPRFSPDGARLVYRARRDGKRFVVVADTTGKVLREHPPCEAVFDFRFSPDGKSVGYGVRKGRELWWMVEPL